MEKLPKFENSESLYDFLEEYPIFTSQDKFHLVLVLNGLKRVCNIEIVKPDKDGYKKGMEVSYKKNTQVFQESIKGLQSILNQFNLNFNLEMGHVDREDDCTGYDVAIFDVSKKQEPLDVLSEISSEPNIEIKQEKLGRIYDIPETAITAWRNGKIKDRDTLPEHVKKSDYYNFIDFALSEEHWEEELEFIKQKANNIKQLAPRLYKEIVSGK